MLSLGYGLVGGYKHRRRLSNVGERNTRIVLRNYSTYISSQRQDGRGADGDVQITRSSTCAIEILDELLC